MMWKEEERNVYLKPDGINYTGRMINIRLDGIRVEIIFSMWNCFQEFHAVISGSKYTIYRQEKVNVFMKKSIRQGLLSLSGMRIKVDNNRGSYVGTHWE